MGKSGDLYEALAAVGHWTIGLLDVGTLNMLTDFEVHPGFEQIYYYRGPLDHVVTTIDGSHTSECEELFGHSTLTSGRVLLESHGRCTGCERQIDLTRDDARDHVHIHTARRTKDHQLDDSEADHNSSAACPDWPAVLCNTCHDIMRIEKISRFIDFKFTLHPRCPSCSARYSRSALLGRISEPPRLPWQRTLGCRYSEPRPKWVCGACGYRW